MHPMITVNTMLTPPTQAQLDYWQERVPDVKAPRDFLANEAMLDYLDYLRSPDGQAHAHKSRKYKMGDRVNHPLHCQRCGKPFTSKRGTAKYCNTKCRQRRPALPMRQCGNCPELFQPLRSNARYHPECRQRAYRVKSLISTAEPAYV